MSTSKLFQPTKVGDILLNHRVVLAPLTRFRADANHVPLPHVAQYYSQRGSVPGTLLITEGTLIAPRAGGYPNVPGIWSDEQIAAWKKITDAVHAKGSFIYLQLWALGRAAKPDALTNEDPSLPFVSASDIGLSSGTDGTVPRPLTVPEINEYVQLYAFAASNAVHKAGFDGVEVHSANGYLPDQFLQDVSNKRTDEYGGSVENRARFVLEIVDAVSKTVGVNRTGIRFSPWGTFQDMRMANPEPTFAHVVTQLRDQHPDLAYIHVVEPRVDGASDAETIIEGQSNNFLRAIWGDRPFLSAGGYTRELGIETADNAGDLIVYGRPFIANPDLPFRLEHNIPLTVGDRSTYYVFGSEDPAGYTDYPFSEAFEEVNKESVESRL